MAVAGAGEFHAIAIQVPGCHWVYEAATSDDDGWCVWFLDVGSRSCAPFDYQLDADRWPVQAKGSAVERQRVQRREGPGGWHRWGPWQTSSDVLPLVDACWLVAGGGVMGGGRDWRVRAECRGVDPELFFPVGDSGPAVAGELVWHGSESRNLACRFAVDWFAVEQFVVVGAFDEDRYLYRLVMVAVDHSELAHHGHICGQQQAFQFLGGGQACGYPVGEVSLFVTEFSQRLWCAAPDLGLAGQWAAAGDVGWVVGPGQLKWVAVVQSQPVPQDGCALCLEVEGFGDVGGWAHLSDAQQLVGVALGAGFKVGTYPHYMWLSASHVDSFTDLAGEKALCFERGEGALDGGVRRAVLGDQVLGRGELCSDRQLAGHDQRAEVRGDLLVTGAPVALVSHVGSH